MTIPSGSSFPVLPLRDIVVFPHMIVPLFVGREKSVRALEDVMRDDKQILLVAQKDAGQDDPSQDDIFRVGTVGTVLQLLKLPDGTVKVLVEGGPRARIVRFTDNPDFFQASAELIVETDGDANEIEALARLGRRAADDRAQGDRPQDRGARTALDPRRHSPRFHVRIAWLRQC